MSIERRAREASGLRRLFEEQWNQLRRLAAGTEPEVAATIEHLVDGTDRRIRAVGGYRQRLRQSARRLLDYVEEVVASLPAAIDVSRRSFVSDPRVNAFFASVESIDELVGRSGALHAFFAADPAAGPDEAYFSLLMLRRERTVLGMDLSGDTLRRDVLQTSVSFVGHHIVEPRPSEELARGALRRCLIDSLAQHVRRRMLRLEGPGDQPYGAGAGRDGGLTETAARRDPESYLRELTSLLEQPQETLRLERGHLRVSKMGIKLTAAEEVPANELELSEIGLGDEAARVLLLARFPRAELRPAAEEFDPGRGLR